MIVITAWSHAEVDAHIAGADRFVSKPFDPDELSAAVAELLVATLARRMWLASAALAILVGAAFTALVLAVSAQREATDREARSKDVTTASLQLEKLVSDARDGLSGVHRHTQGERVGALLQRAAASCRPDCGYSSLPSLTTLTQRTRVQRL